MAVRIRLTRLGRTHRPFYRVVAIDSRYHREGRAKEILGTYDPLQAEKNIQVDIERVHQWLRQGAQLTEAVRSLLKREGYEAVPEDIRETTLRHRAQRAEQRKKRAKKSGDIWQKPSRRALLKHQKAQKIARKEAAEAALAQHRATQQAAQPAETSAEETSAE